MPLPTIANVTRFAFGGQIQGGGRWVNVWHMNYTGGGFATQAAATIGANELAKLYDSSVIVGGQGWIPAFGAGGETLDKADVINLDGTSATFSLPYTITGPGGTPGEAAECAHVLTLRTGFRGRSHRGRVFLPQVQNSQVANGQLNAAIPPLIIARFNSIFTTLAGLSWVPVVASYKLGTATPITSVSMDTLVDVIRGRKR